MHPKAFWTYTNIFLHIAQGPKCQQRGMCDGRKFMIFVPGCGFLDDFGDAVLLESSAQGDNVGIYSSQSLYKSCVVSVLGT